TFENGTAKQQTSQPIGAGQTMTIRMDWRAIAAAESDLQVRLTAFVSLEGHAGEEKSSAVMSVQIAALASMAAKSTPVLNRLDGFPPEILLFAFGSERRSNALTSGASVTSADAGVVVMRFEAPDGYRFDNNTAAQSTSQTFAAGETATMTMSWRMTTARENDLSLRIRVGISLQDHPGEEFQSAVMTIAKPSMMQKLLNRIRG
ncbi:MAG: hypothetical protein QOJ98_2530, partial [Acidobacteriota bacterium]|nr:hypothetical protein [Acidobacteriota bacterium]